MAGTEEQLGTAAATIDVENPATGEVVSTVPVLGEAELEAIARRGRDAQPAWARAGFAARAQVMLRARRWMLDNAARVIDVVVSETGKTREDAQLTDLGYTVTALGFWAKHAAGYLADERIPSLGNPAAIGKKLIVAYEPIGLVGVIGPWNFPIVNSFGDCIPALMAGNSVILKPAEITPLTSLKIAELAAEAGVPEGVINMVPGLGAVAGQYIAEHPAIAKIAFTGSTATGRRIVQASAGNLKKVHLELGGKGANIIFDDADLGAAVNGSAFAIFHNQGQACIAGSRLMLHERIADEFLERFTALARTIRVGNPLDPATEMGPLTSAQHRDRVLGYVATAREEGGQVLLGGRAPQDGALSRGFYLEPTVVRARTYRDRIAQEEVFGPFVTVLTFSDEEEALRIANSTDYGLGSGLWTRDIGRAHRFAREIKTGMVWVNCYKRVHPASPFGGVGQSGYGRDMGFAAMDEYTQMKSVWVNVDAALPPWYPR